MAAWLTHPAHTLVAALLKTFLNPAGFGHTFPHTEDFGAHRVHMCLTRLACLVTQAKDGTMNLSETLEEVLHIINCTPDDVRRFVQQHPPQERLTKVPKAASVLAKLPF